jgi:hypothetical protein
MNDDIVVCVQCGAETPETELAGWRPTEWGHECPPCARVQEAAEAREQEEGVEAGVGVAAVLSAAARATGSA